MQACLISKLVFFSIMFYYSICAFAPFLHHGVGAWNSSTLQFSLMSWELHCSVSITHYLALIVGWTQTEESFMKNFSQIH